VGFQNSVMGLSSGYAACSYSLIKPPRTGRRVIRLSFAVGDRVVWPRRAELATAVGSPTVVVSGVGRQDGSQVLFAEDQHTVGEFGSGGEHESFGEAVRSGAARRNLHNVDTHVCQYGVERCRELTGSVADEKPEFGGPITKIHQKITGLLSGPRAVRVRRQAKDVHVAAADFQGEQHVDPF
jgi:hypothetical protein